MEVADYEKVVDDIAAVGAQAVEYWSRLLFSGFWSFKSVGTSVPFRAAHGDWHGLSLVRVA